MTYNESTARPVIRPASEKYLVPLSRPSSISSQKEREEYDQFRMKVAHWVHDNQLNTPDEVKTAEKAQRDLVGRSWKTERELSRDERRLFSKYRATIEAHEDAEAAAYLAHVAASHQEAQSALDLFTKEQPS